MKLGYSVLGAGTAFVYWWVVRSPVESAGAPDWLNFVLSLTGTVGMGSAVGWVVGWAIQRIRRGDPSDRNKGRP